MQQSPFNEDYIFCLGLYILLICSACCLAIFFSGCATGLNRPDSNFGIVNAQAKHIEGYNILHDYDSNGVRTATSPTWIVPLTDLSSLNGYAVTNPIGLKNIKTSISDARAYIANHCTCH